MRFGPHKASARDQRDSAQNRTETSVVTIAGQTWRDYFVNSERKAKKDVITRWDLIY